MRLGSVALAGLVLFGGASWAATGDPLVVTGDGVNVRSDPNTDSRILMQVYRNQQVIELERQGDWVRAEVAGTDGVDGWIHVSLLAPPEGGSRAVAPEPEPEPEPQPEAAAAAPTTPAVPAPESSGTASATAPETTSETVVPETTAEQPPETTAEQPPETTAEQPSETAAEQPPEMAAATPSAEAQNDLPAMPEPAAGPAAGQLAGLAQFRESVDYLNQRAQDLAGVDLFGNVEVAGEGVVQVVTAEGWSTVTPAGQQSFLNTLAARWAAAQGGEGPASVQIVDPNGRVVMEKSGL